MSTRRVGQGCAATPNCSLASTRLIFRFSFASSLRVAAQSLSGLDAALRFLYQKLPQPAVPQGPCSLNAAKADVSCVVEKYHRKSLPLFIAGFCIFAVLKIYVHSVATRSNLSNQLITSRAFRSFVSMMKSQFYRARTATLRHRCPFCSGGLDELKSKSVLKATTRILPVRSM